MSFASAYRSKTPDAAGRFAYSASETAVWRDLVDAQMRNLADRACPAVLRGVELLGLHRDAVPQVVDVDRRLRARSGFGLAPVPAMISERDFFGLLRDGVFPVATFVRRRDEIDYLTEPDIFHEVFGHGPLLTEPAYAAFHRRIGALAMSLPERYLVPLHRLFWFTVEFGLMNTQQGLRVYGAGLVSSPMESVAAIDSPHPERRPFDPIEVMRTDYRIDTPQPRYFVIDGFEALYALLDGDVVGLMDEALRAGAA